MAEYATNSYGTGYGNDIVFTTSSFPDCGTINYIGEIYETVVIGEQCWMKKNLSYLTNSGSWCYNNSSVNCGIYGRLYTWFAMMNGEESSNNVPSGVQGICPDGWHIPSDAEWDILVNHLGSYLVAGGKMKETGTLHWNHPNNGATNLSGFSALPGGNYFLDNNIFYNMGVFADFWTSTEDPSTANPTAFDRMLDYNNGKVNRNHLNSSYFGLSVRCLKDD